MADLIPMVDPMPIVDPIFNCTYIDPVYTYN